MRSRAVEDISARPTLATAKDIAGRIYVDPHQVIERMMAQYAEHGDARALVSEVERSPSSFGSLRGTTCFRITNGERRSALEQAPMMARQMDAHFEVLDRIKDRVVEQHESRRVAMRKPLPDLSQETGVFLDQFAQVHRMPSGWERDPNAILKRPWSPSCRTSNTNIAPISVIEPRSTQTS